MMHTPQSDQADIRQIKPISTIWVIPIIALIIAVWMFAHYEMNKGEVITLRLKNAASMIAGKTAIKSLNVTVGTITDIRLSDDYTSIIAKAQMDRSAKRMLRTDSYFWVVKPRVGSTGISGLDTLLSGVYIELQPGTKGVPKRDFTVLSIPPVAAPDAKGLHIVLTSKAAGKLNVGDPVLYEGFTVGRVERVNFDAHTKQAQYQLFIRQPYDHLVRTSSKFWTVSGVNMALNAQGINVSVGSLETLISGGVTFKIPHDIKQGEPVTESMHTFTLYDSWQKVKENIYDKYLEYVMLFDESVRGLNEGAPVEYRGIRIGTVKKVPLVLPTLKDSLSSHEEIPVLVRIELERVYKNINEKSLSSLQSELEASFQHGLRSSLKVGSLLTGALFIDVDTYEKTQPFTPNTFHNYRIFPTQTGGATQISKQIREVLAKLNHLPLEKTVESVNTVLSASKSTLVRIEEMTQSMHQLLLQKDSQALPKAIHDSLNKLQKTLNTFDPNSTAYHNISRALVQFQQVMKELQPILKQLNKKPNALIFGNATLQDPLPVTGNPK